MLAQPGSCSFSWALELIDCGGGVGVLGKASVSSGHLLLRGTIEQFHDSTEGLLNHVPWPMPLVLCLTNLLLTPVLHAAC